MAKVALVQMVSCASVEDNLKTLEPYFMSAASAGARLVVLPENFAFMGHNERDKLKIAEQRGVGLIQQTVARLAKQYGVFVIAGTIPIQTGGEKVYASSIVYDDGGHEVAFYNKIHLFDVEVSEQESHCESRTVMRGDEVVVVDTPVGRVGLSVCYDLRFPELYNALRQKGAMLFAVPSAFTAITGQAHWDVLLRARAIENLCYVLAPNQGGVHENGRHTHGYSMVVEPWGTVVSSLKHGAGLMMADIDLERLNKLRAQFPCQDHHVLNPVLGAM